MSELEVGTYEIAHLCGGAERVVMVALVQLHTVERIKISTARHRVEVRSREAADPIEAAVLDAVPDVGKVRDQVIGEVSRSAAVADLVTKLRADGLIARHRVPVGAGLTRRGRRLRKELQAAVKAGSEQGTGRCVYASGPSSGDRTGVESPKVAYTVPDRELMLGGVRRRRRIRNSITRNQMRSATIDPTKKIAS